MCFPTLSVLLAVTLRLIFPFFPLRLLILVRFLYRFFPPWTPPLFSPFFVLVSPYLFLYLGPPEDKKERFSGELTPPSFSFQTHYFSQIPSPFFPSSSSVALCQTQSHCAPAKLQTAPIWFLNAIHIQCFLFPL